MKVKLQVQKHGNALYEGVYDVSDADSFGRACAHAWMQLQKQKIGRASSIGALFESLDERLLDELQGAQISLSPA